MRAAAESTITSMAIALADGLRAGFPDQRERYAKVLDPRSLCGLEIRTAPSGFGLSVRPMAPHRVTAQPPIPAITTNGDKPPVAHSQW
jgi:hypothetical protein